MTTSADSSCATIRSTLVRDLQDGRNLNVEVMEHLESCDECWRLVDSTSIAHKGVRTLRTYMQPFHDVMHAISLRWYCAGLAANEPLYDEFHIGGEDDSSPDGIMHYRYPNQTELARRQVWRFVSPLVLWPMNTAAFRWVCKHWLHHPGYVNEDWGGPESGGMGGYCTWCGWSFEHVLY